MLSICNDPQLFDICHIGSLRNAVNKFYSWLNEEAIIQEVWFPSINAKINLRIRREDYISIYGNTSKHNSTRQTRQVKNLRNIFKNNGVELSITESQLAIKDFREQFEGIYTYHASTLAEFLNNIKWGVYKYLNPLMKLIISYSDPSDPFKYCYIYRKQIESKLGKDCFWELMNDVRDEPYIPEFKVTKFLKMRY